MNRTQWSVFLAVISLSAFGGFSGMIPLMKDSRPKTYQIQTKEFPLEMERYIPAQPAGNSEKAVPLVAFSCQSAPVDMYVVTINTPVSGNNLTSSEIVTITLQNQGTQGVKNLKVAFQIGQSVPVIETITQIIAPGSTFQHSFTSRANLSVPGSYAFKAYSMAVKDAVPANDTAFKTVVNIKL